MKVVIMRGIPGSGKSTYISKNYPDALVCSADHYFMRDGKYEFDRSKLDEAHKYCLWKFIDSVTLSYHSLSVVKEVVVDNTNISIAELAPYAAIALLYGCELEILTLKVPPEIAHKRQVHGVPLEKVISMSVTLDEQDKYIPSRWPHRRV